MLGYSNADSVITNLGLISASNNPYCHNSTRTLFDSDGLFTRTSGIYRAKTVRKDMPAAAKERQPVLGFRITYSEQDCSEAFHN